MKIDCSTTAQSLGVFVPFVFFVVKNEIHPNTDHTGTNERQSPGNSDRINEILRIVWEVHLCQQASERSIIESLPTRVESLARLRAVT